MKPFLYSLLLIFSLSLLLWARPVITTAEGAPTAGTSGGSGAAPLMPKQCKPGKTSPEAHGWRWKQGTPVRVFYLKDNFSAAEVEALSRAVHSWNNALREMDSRIAFTIGGERETVAKDHASVTVVRGVPRVRERVGETRFYSMSNGSARLTMTINPVVTNLGALTSLMTHELGHSLGLADCYECRRGTTAMAAFKGDNKGNDVYEPSVCDKYVVAAGYASQIDAQARVVPMEQE
jgi:hypothetical protein